jgi:hypothetical protein
VNPGNPDSDCFYLENPGNPGNLDSDKMDIKKAPWLRNLGAFMSPSTIIMFTI